MEIERKFLIDLSSVPFALEELKSTSISQAYLVVSSDSKEVRIRKKDSCHFLTVKSGNGMSRAETEVELSKDQYLQLLPAAADRVIEKTRYEIPIEDLTGELDVYHGRHQGLSVIEVEFSSEEAARGFQVPAWFGPEKTDDSSYKNAALAGA